MRCCLAHAWRALRDGSDADLREVAELAAAFAPSRERQMETLNQGDAFMTATRAAWPAPRLDRLARGLGRARGLSGGGRRQPRPHMACRLPRRSAPSSPRWPPIWSRPRCALVPLGQTDGNRVLAGLVAEVRAAAQAAPDVPLDAIAGAALRSDIASMRHETQYTRLFRS